MPLVFRIHTSLTHQNVCKHTLIMGNLTSASVSDLEPADDARLKELEERFDISERGFFPSTEPLRYCAKIPNFEAVAGSLPDINERKSKTELLAVRESGQESTRDGIFTIRLGYLHQQSAHQH